MEFTFTLIASAIFILYCFVYSIFRLIKSNSIFPPSISSSFYFYQKYYGKFTGYVFTIFLFIEAFLLLYPMIEIGAGSNFQFLGFLCPAGLGFCGAAPLSQCKEESPIHVAGAMTGAIAGLIWCLVFTNVVSTLLILAVIGFFSFCLASVTNCVRYSKTYWLEIVGFGTIMLSLLWKTM